MISLDLATDDGPLQASLGRITAATDLSPVLSGEVDQYIRGWLARVFETEGAKNGTKWAPLSPRYLAWKQRQRRGNMGILRFTQRLMKSYTVNGPDALLEVSPTRYARGSRVPYAERHQQGGGGIPARPVMTDPPPAAFVTGVANIVRQFIDGRLG